MLTPVEQIIFIALVLICGALAFHGFSRMLKIVRSGLEVKLHPQLARRLVKAFIDVGLQKPLFRARPLVSVFHAFIFYGFTFYLLVNINDLLEGFATDWSTLEGSSIAQGFNLFSDLFSVFILIGMIFFLYRRFVLRPKALDFNSNVKLHPKAITGIRIDSLIVGGFILLHVGSRWLGTAFHLAERGQGNPWMPTASLVAGLMEDFSPAALEVGIHVSWWLAMGLIVVFVPYFPHSKHIHLMVAPVNLALGGNKVRGEMDEVHNPSAPGAQTLSDLSWPLILDAYACIMCTRCQEVCPAHHSGTPLSPAALEINKRYHIKENSKSLAAGGRQQPLLEYAISEDAVWSCTTCYACVRVCPVGNDPMADILELRRHMVFDGTIPDELTEVLRSLDEHGNSFGESARKRTGWTKQLDFEIKDASREPVKYLWYVGDFASFHQDCQEISRKVAQVLHAAGVDFGILKKGEKSTGNDVRRVGEEGLFEALTEENIKTLDQCQFEEIFTTDPHTFNALKNEFPHLGGQYKVQHYSTLLLGLIRSGQIQLKKKVKARVTFHDPCYLGRYNGGYDAPRQVMQLCGVELQEMPRNRENSFCCGAGGGRIWMKDHEEMTQRPSENRIEEALGLDGIHYFTVACPKDLSMYSDAVKTSGNEGKIEVRDIIDFVIEAMDLPAPLERQEIGVQTERSS